LTPAIDTVVADSALREVRDLLGRVSARLPQILQETQELRAQASEIRERLDELAARNNGQAGGSQTFPRRCDISSQLDFNQRQPCSRSYDHGCVRIPAASYV